MVDQRQRYDKNNQTNDVQHDREIVDEGATNVQEVVDETSEWKGKYLRGSWLIIRILKKVVSRRTDDTKVRK